MMQDPKPVMSMRCWGSADRCLFGVAYMPMITVAGIKKQFRPRPLLVTKGGWSFRGILFCGMLVFLVRRQSMRRGDPQVNRDRIPIEFFENLFRFGEKRETEK